MPKLGVNIDHVATIRQARRTVEPDPVWAAAEAQLGGADCITAHLREDRRHIQDRDVRILKETVTVKFNLEMAASDEIIRIAREIAPTQATLVPERRQEVTTEGGLDVVSHANAVHEAADALRAAGIRVSIFIDPDSRQVTVSQEVGADAIEINTGAYAEASPSDRAARLEQVRLAAHEARRAKLEVLAGHGLTYVNVRPIAAIPEIVELNIGHSIVSRAVLVGLDRAVREMMALLK